jgi:ribokinase
MKLLNFGSCNIDYVYKLDHIVNPGETESVKEMKIFPGGKGLNQSIAISRAGSRVYHGGAIGEDGVMLSELLKENNIDVEFLRKVEEKTGHAIIQVANSAENSIFVYSGANACIEKEYVDFVLENFSEEDFLLLQNEISNVEYIIDRAFQKGMTIILNPSPINEQLKCVDIEKISYLILNRTEAQILTGCENYIDALKYFNQHHPNTKVVLTLGEKGSVFSSQNEKLYQPSYQVEAVDTTAAGDTYTGYFVSGLIKGQSLQNSMKFASCAAAISVSRNGAAPSIPFYAEVKEKLSCMKTNKLTLKDERIKRMVEDVIKDNIANVSLVHIAKNIGFSTVHTGRLIKKLFGMSYQKLLIEKRLDMANELLQNTDFTISDIIAMVGYENQGYFRKKFLERFGETPSDYKKKYR